ncbi:hypothetical protein Tco_1146083 [Tanacetum coccineum]
MIEKKEIEQDEEPTRGTLWLKGRVNKDGEYQDDEIRSVGDKLKETEDKIKERTLQVDQGTDAMKLVRRVNGDKRKISVAAQGWQLQSTPTSIDTTDGNLLNLWELRERLYPSTKGFFKSEDSQSKENCRSTTSGFVAWPKNQVVFDPKATPPSTIQMITVENKTAPKVPTKRKNFYVSSDAMQKEANK